MFLYFWSSVKFELNILQTSFQKKIWLFCVYCVSLLWLNYLSDSISFLPAIVIINNGLYRCLIFSFSFLSAQFFFSFLRCWRRLFCFIVLVWVFLFFKSSTGNFLSNYLFGELSLHATTGYSVFSFTSCFRLRALLSDTLINLLFS